MKPKRIEIMPYGFSISFKLQTKDYNKKIKRANLLEIKKIIVAASGPITNVLIIIASLMYNNSVFKSLVVYSNLVIILFNILPIYPLDGGRILKGLLHILYGGEKSNIIINRISNIVMIIITAFGSIAVYYYENIAIFIIILFLWSLRIKENKRFKMIINAYRIIKGGDDYECLDQQLDL